MATIVREYVPEHRESNNGLGLLLGVVLVLVLGFLLFYYGLPVLRGSMGSQVNIPSSIDINLHNTGK